MKGMVWMANIKEEKDGGSGCRCGEASSGRAGKWIWIVLALAVAGVLIAKHTGRKPSGETRGAANAAVQVGGPGGTVPVAARQGQPLPRLVDLGAGKCIPCKMMAPILEDLKKTYAGQLDVQFIDVWENPDAGKPYGIQVIPTQIFYDAAGKERFRHEGFFGREDILAKWKEFGVDLTAAKALSDEMKLTPPQTSKACKIGECAPK